MRMVLAKLWQVIKAPCSVCWYCPTDVFCPEVMMGRFDFGWTGRSSTHFMGIQTQSGEHHAECCVRFVTMLKSER